MGYRYQQAQKLLALQTRERLRQEQLAFDNNLFSNLVPKDATTRFRCQMQQSEEGVKPGDQVLLYKEPDGGVKVLKQNKLVALLVPEAADDLHACLPDDEAEFYLAEFVSERDSLDDTADLVLKSPHPESQKPTK